MEAGDKRGTELAENEGLAATAPESAPLSDDELRIAVGMLPASLGGSILGSALLWMQACRGAAVRLGSLGAVEALGAELQEAIEAQQRNRCLKRTRLSVAST